MDAGGAVSGAWREGGAARWCGGGGGGGGGGGDGIRGKCYLKSSRNPILGSSYPIYGVTAT